MSDKLKLADGHGDAEIEKIAQAKEMDELNRRIRELEQNVARLKALHEERARVAREAAATKAAGNNKIGARKHSGFKAISTAPSINKTPIGPSMVPLPYPTVQDLSNSTSTARSVRFNGAPAYLLDGTTQPKCTGDEPGTGKGIRSGTVSGEVKPVKGSSTVRIEGKHVVRDGDACTMNGGNNPGIYVTTQVPSSAPPKDAIKTSNPPIVLDTHEEKSTFMKIVEKANEHVLVAKDNVKAAFDRPIEGAKGIVKGIVNIVPSVTELVLKGAALSGAAQVAESEATLTVVGQTELAKKQGALAEEMQEAASNVSVPKLPLNNAAQEGGDTISILASVIAGGVGILKSGARLLGGLGKAGKAAEAAKAAEVASGVGKINKAAGPAAGRASDGVKIAGNDRVPTYEELQDLAANSLDFSTKPNGAVFWSGPNNMKLAQWWANLTGKTTLEQTVGGKYLDSLKLFDGPSPAQAAQIWDTASVRFAKGASGNVNVFNKGATQFGPYGERTWWRLEEPALQGNSEVTKIRKWDWTMDPNGLP